MEVPLHARRRWRIVLGFLASALAGTAISAADEASQSAEAWKALASGYHVAVIHHAHAPGPSEENGSDPPGFILGDCSTQRNLDAVGKEQAAALGRAFREHGVRVKKVLSSPWCRCLETARLLGLGHVKKKGDLAPYPTRRSRRLQEMAHLRHRVSTWERRGTLVLVTHGQTVRKYLALELSEGETVVLQPTPGQAAGFKVVGRIPPAR